MTDQRPFRVEVVVDAPREEVWRALTEPERVARWFGWDYDGLASEIQYIFVDHARHEPPGLIELDDGQDNQTIELIEEGPRTRVICFRPGPLDGADWDELYEDVREGWITFFAQLRHSVERHPEEDRRTIRLTGEAVPAEVVEALGRELSGPVSAPGALPARGRGRRRRRPARGRASEAAGRLARARPDLGHRYELRPRRRGIRRPG